MHRVAITVAALAAALVAAAGLTAATAPSVTIHAEFRANERATHYTLILTNGPLADIPAVTWKLDLVKIDDNGKVDPTCTKTEDGPTQTEFIWHHGDNEGCNHAFEGAHGHQGRITVNVHMRDWDCSTTYDGTTGVPADGPTKLCTSNEPAAATGPCDDERADLAQLDAEIAAAEESLRLIDASYWRASSANLRAEYQYYNVAYSRNPSSQAVWDAWYGWHVAYTEYRRLYDAYSEILNRLANLKAARLKAATAVSECQVKGPLGRMPSARCTSALIDASSARGRAAGYALVGSRVKVAKLMSLSTATRSLSGRLRAVAAQAPKERARLLRDARTGNASAASLARGAVGLRKVQSKQASAARTAQAAQAELTACRAG